jgi:hypothetical protein
MLNSNTYGISTDMLLEWLWITPQVRSGLVVSHPDGYP